MTDPFDKFDEEPREFTPTTDGITPPSAEEILAGLDKDMPSPQRQMAMTFHQLYLDFVASGFDKNQALTLTSTAVNAQMQINATIALMRRRDEG